LLGRLNEDSIRDVQNMFNAGPVLNPKLGDGEDCTTDPAKCGIKLHIIGVEEVPQVDQLTAWQDFNTDVDDFAHYKSLFFNEPNDRAVLHSQTSAFNLIGDASIDLDGDGLFGEDGPGGGNEDRDCTDGTSFFTSGAAGTESDGIPDDCFDSTDAIVTERVELIDEDPRRGKDLDGDGLTQEDRRDGINVDDDCRRISDGVHFRGDFTPGTVDDCFDASDNVRVTLTELIDEDPPMDEFEWVITGIDIETPENDLFVNTAGRIIIEEQVEFSGPTIVAMEGTQSWAVGADAADTVFRIDGAGMITSIVEDDSPGAPANSFIIRVEATFEATDTNLIDEAGIDIGTIRVNFLVQDTITVIDNNVWRISPDVITTADDARAFYVHYVLVADSIGPCGPSGLAELLGNDIILGLGCNYLGTELSTTNGDPGAVDPNPDPNNDNKPPTVGTQQQFANALAHEMGHNFELLHGGPAKTNNPGSPILDSNINCKPDYDNYDSTMSYTHQSTVWLGNLKPHYSSGKLGPLDEDSLRENDGLPSTEPAAPGLLGRKIVFADGNGVVRIDRATNDGDPIDKINWDGDGRFDMAAVSVDINNIPTITGCDASFDPPEEMFDHDDWNSLRLVFNFAAVAFDGITACAFCIPDYTSIIDQEAIDSLPWYNGLLRHSQLIRNFDIFDVEITNEVIQNRVMDVSFEFYNGNPNNRFDDPTFVDRVIDVNKNK